MYHEWASERDDGLHYSAFLFRNSDRTVFGIREFLGKEFGPGDGIHKKWAHKVVTDQRFRDSLISSDPDLPRMWKNH